ncbi:Mitochondrial oxaloacetate carrier protein [Modicella reniformis]|uniref:Mitochondrial oxaloacetate carrier protein n=1 Tax=Modicella reniformis TaxID=1440133 RepID=A0A9P6J1X5_9FUNG|nr:Mitochondrial oxaloacetate carrier protein [Modicella reniformis]
MIYSTNQTALTKSSLFLNKPPYSVISSPSSMDCFIKTFRHRGMRGLRKSLFPAIQFSKNIFRLGLYNLILNSMYPLNYPGEISTTPAWKRMITGATCGAMGTISVNPFDLTTYSLIKDGVLLDMLSSLASAFISVVVMNPMDVVRIRLYNRSSQSTSQTILQSCRHILTTEGPMTFYKGFSTHFMRIDPHFTLTFVFLGMLKR